MLRLEQSSAGMARRGWVLILLSLHLVHFIYAKECCDDNVPPESQTLIIAAIRIVSNKATETNKGRVELQGANGVWGTICPKYWNSDDGMKVAGVICRMLGFRYGGSVIDNQYGDGNKNILIENVTCPVNATSLDQCQQKLIKTCTHEDKELAVECNEDVQGSTYVNLTDLYIQTSGYVPTVRRLNEVITYGNCSTTADQARIVGGDDPATKDIGNGYPQRLVNNVWSFISGEFWDEAAAKVFCRELCYNVAGFTPLPGVMAKSVPDQVNPNIQLQGFKCLGHENRLEECQNLGNRSSSIKVPIAGVQCAPACQVVNVNIPYLNCSSGSLQIFIGLMEFHYLITADDIQFYNKFPNGCINVTSNMNGTLVTILSTSTCRTTMEENATHIIYSNQLKLVLASDRVVVKNYINRSYNLFCAVPKQYVVSNRYQPYEVEKGATIYDQYNYTLSMDLYTNCNFTELRGTFGSMYLVETGQQLFVLITITNYDNKTKVVIDSCHASAVMPYSSNTPVVVLFKEKCPVEESLTMYSLDDRRQGFQVTASAFVGYSMVHLTCSVNICLRDSNSTECDRTCRSSTSRRRKRQAGLVKTSEIQSRDIILLDLEEYLKSSGQANGAGSDIQNGITTSRKQEVESSTSSSDTPQQNTGSRGHQNAETTTIFTQFKSSIASTRQQDETEDSSPIARQDNTNAGEKASSISLPGKQEEFTGIFHDTLIQQEREEDLKSTACVINVFREVFVLAVVVVKIII